MYGKIGAPVLAGHFLACEAVLFDMDGVLTINEHYHGQAWRYFARNRLAIDVAEDDPRLHGGRIEEVLALLTGQIPGSEMLRICHAERESHYRDLARGKLRPVPGLHSYLDWLARRGVPCALVTSADVINVAFVLGELGLEKRFSIKVTAGDVKRGKPDPEPYLLAAARVGVDPKVCLVHEDAPAGIQSALAAACSVVALTTTLAAAVLEAAGANLCVADFNSWMAVIGASSTEL